MRASMECRFDPYVCNHRNGCAKPEANEVMRLGFNQVLGFRQEHAAKLVRQRSLAAFHSLQDFRMRVELTKEELRALARLGALNCFCGHRRTALWQVERDLPLEENRQFCFRQTLEANPPASPLRPMNVVERMQADYRTQRLTTGPHPMKLMRKHLPDCVERQRGRSSPSRRYDHHRGRGDLSSASRYGQRVRFFIAGR